jgi:hypothetical protein
MCGKLYPVASFLCPVGGQNDVMEQQCCEKFLQYNTKQYCCATQNNVINWNNGTTHSSNIQLNSVHRSTMLFDLKESVINIQCNTMKYKEV